MLSPGGLCHAMNRRSDGPVAGNGRHISERKLDEHIDVADRFIREVYPGEDCCAPSATIPKDWRVHHPLRHLGKLKRTWARSEYKVFFDYAHQFSELMLECKDDIDVDLWGQMHAVLVELLDTHPGRRDQDAPDGERSR